MKLAVRYYSRGGNTKKIAAAIAKGCRGFCKRNYIIRRSMHNGSPI